MEDDERLELERRYWKEESRFWSPRAKPERERWVVGEFLAHLGVAFSKNELMTCDVHSKIDIVFRDARFQVKEIPDPGTRRGDEVKALRKQAELATRPEEVVGLSIAYDVPAPERGYDLVLKKAQEEAQRLRIKGYEGVLGTLDLLIYITRTRTAPIRPDEMDTQKLSSTGWRSISYLIGDEARVLYSRNDAPRFLRTGSASS